MFVRRWIGCSYAYKIAGDGQTSLLLISDPRIDSFLSGKTKAVEISLDRAHVPDVPVGIYLLDFHIFLSQHT